VTARGTVPIGAIYRGSLRIGRRYRGPILVWDDGTTTAPTDPGTTPPPDTQAASIYWGARIDGNAPGYVAASGDAPWAQDNWDIFQSHAGKVLSYIHWGVTSGFSGAAGTLNYDENATNLCKGRGAISGCTLGLSNAAGIDAVVADTANARTYWQDFFNQIKVHGVPVLLRCCWEMNGNWSSQPAYAWQTVHGTTSTEYVTMWRRLWQYCADVMSGNGTAGSNTGTHTGNCSWYWCPNLDESNTGGTPGSFAPWYPGDAYVDWAGFDGYAYTGTYKSPAQRYNYTYDQLVALVGPSIPFFIGEMGVSATIGTPGKAAWITDFLGTWLPAHPRVKGWSWFNETGSPTDPHIENPASAQTAFAAGVAGSYFKAGVSPYPANGSKVTVPT
jgi:hypothetical protein